MASLTTKEYECEDCGHRYRMLLTFLNTHSRARDRGCPKCGSYARKRRRDGFSFLRDAFLTYSTV